MHHKVSEKKLQYALYALIAIGVLLTGYALLSSGNPPMLIQMTQIINFNAGGAQATPSPTPQVDKAKLVLTIITVPECRYCVDLKDLITRIKSAGDAQIISEKTVSYKDATALMAKYGITKVPTVLLSGETAKVSGLKNMWSQIGEEQDDGTLVLTKMRPMYYDTAKGDFVGKLKVIRLVNSTCGEACTKASVIQGNFETNTGIRFVEEQEREANSTQAKELAVKYNITKIPAIIITGDVDAYNELGLKTAWLKVGTVESDGALVWRLINPPYQEYPSGKDKGFATLIGIEDPNCKQCYNVAVHKSILANLGVYFATEAYYNATQPQAKALIEKYNITLLPTVIVDGELKEYYPFTSLEQIWNQVGTVEKDGWNVYRNMTALGSNVTYIVIATNETKATK